MLYAGVLMLKSVVLVLHRLCKGICTLYSSVERFDRCLQALHRCSLISFRSYVHPTRLIDYSVSLSRNLEVHFWRCVRLFPGGGGGFWRNN